MELKSAANTGKIIIIVEKLCFTSPKRKAGLMIMTTPIKQTNVSNKCNLLRGFW